MDAPAARADLEALVLRFADAFNRNDLDEVMTHFAEDAVYEPLDGLPVRGPAAIRAAFVPQFRGDFGRMRFVTQALLVDEVAGRVVFQWRCQHDFSSPEAWPRAVRWRQLPFRVLYGQACEWEGVDVLHVAHGRLQRKQTYSRAKLPLARPVR